MCKCICGCQWVPSLCIQLSPIVKVLGSSSGRPISYSWSNNKGKVWSTEFPSQSTETVLQWARQGIVRPRIQEWRCRKHTCYEPSSVCLWNQDLETSRRRMNWKISRVYEQSSWVHVKDRNVKTWKKSKYTIASNDYADCKGVGGGVVAVNNLIYIFKNHFSVQFQ